MKKKDFLKSFSSLWEIQVSNKEAITIFLGALQVSGICLILVFMAGIIKFMINHELIPWGRGMLVLLIGIGLYLIGQKNIRRYK